MSKNSNKQEENIKVILLGNSGVGKTEIINRFDNNEFMGNDACTYSSSFIIREIEVNGQKKILEVWDTAGQEKYRSLGKLFVKNVQIVILVYDITNTKSFEDLNYWNDFIQKELGHKITLGLAGNKTDLIDEEKVTKKEGKECAEKWNAFFSLLSAKEDKPGIDLFFTELVKKYLENKTSETNNEEKEKQQSLKINNENNIKNEKNNCCGGGKKTNEIKINIAFLGLNGVGKTNIINSIIGKEINKNYEHTEKINKQLITYIYKDKRKIHSYLIDTNGSDITDPDINDIKKECQIFFLVFDFKNKNSYKELDNLIKKLSSNEKQKKSINILCNKTINPEGENDYITDEEAKEFANKNSVSYDCFSINEIDKLKDLIKNKIDNYLYS